MEQKKMTLEEKYAYAIRSLQAISTRNPNTENADIESDWDNYIYRKAFQECNRSAKTALKILGEAEFLPNYNGGYKARQDRYAKSHKEENKKKFEKIEDVIADYKVKKIIEAETVFSEKFNPWIRLDCHVVGQVLLCIEPFSNMTLEDAIKKDLRSEYAFASRFLKENIFTDEKLKLVRMYLNTNYLYEFMDNPEVKHKIQQEVAKYIQSYLHEYELQHPEHPIWLMAYEYYQKKMRGEA